MVCVLAHSNLGPMRSRARTSSDGSQGSPLSQAGLRSCGDGVAECDRDPVPSLKDKAATILKHKFIHSRECPWYNLLFSLGRSRFFRGVSLAAANLDLCMYLGFIVWAVGDSVTVGPFENNRLDIKWYTILIQHKLP